LSQLIWFNYNIKRHDIVFINEIIVIMVYYLSMVLSLKINIFCHIRHFKTTI